MLKTKSPQEVFVVGPSQMIFNFILDVVYVYIAICPFESSREPWS